jgi:hypothetical protein
LLLVAPKRDFRSDGMKYEVKVRGDGTDLGTVQNTFVELTAKKEPGPEW